MNGITYQPCSHTTCESLINHLRYLAKENDICLHFVQPIYTDFTQPDFLKLAKELMMSYAKVVVLFTIPEHTESLLRESMTPVKIKGGFCG